MVRMPNVTFCKCAYLWLNELLKLTTDLDYTLLGSWKMLSWPFTFVLIKNISNMMMSSFESFIDWNKINPPGLSIETSTIETPYNLSKAEFYRRLSIRMKGIEMGDICSLVVTLMICRLWMFRMPFWPYTSMVSNCT
jgi:hypothetical protein